MGEAGARPVGQFNPAVAKILETDMGGGGVIKSFRF
jgi:hypothetical protein